MKKFSIIAGIMALVLLVSILVGTSDAVLAQGHRGGHHGKGFWSNLTKDQREAVQEKIEQMRSQGATREEIHAATAEMLKGYGLELPEHGRGPHDPGHFGPGGFWCDLTFEQREAICEKIKEMRSQGATRKEIRDAVDEMLEGFGIEPPERRIGLHGPKGFGHGRRGFRADLTDEQRQALREKKEELRNQGANREEIRDAVAEMLKGYGIELPEKWREGHGFHPFGPGPGGFWCDLTDEQREAVHEKKKELRNQGATRKEIRDAVAEMLEGYGIELPEKWREGHGFHPFGPGPGGFWCDLTDEQREAVHEKIKEMRSQGATRKEIRDAVDEMLEGFGIESPGDSESTSLGDASAKPHIQAQSYPNPFNPETQIAYTLSVSEDVRIQIYNVGGQVIRTYDLGYQIPGSYSVRWDGCNENGEPAASGIYLYRIEAGPYDVTNRMVLLK